MKDHDQNIPSSAIVIGGSAGSFKPLCKILTSLPNDFEQPVILCLHRLKTVNKGFAEVLTDISGKQIIEPYDKTPILNQKIYLAPSNYHMYVSPNKVFSLSTEEMINYSRPSIDITFCSAAKTFKNNLTGIILSGANRDGVNGIGQIQRYNGVTIAQNPKECQVITMPQGAIDKEFITHIYNVDQIINHLVSKRDKNSSR